MRVQAEEWRRACEKIFSDTGLSKEDISKLIDVALTADMRGVASHGTVRLIDYRKRLLCGLIEPNPSIRIENDSHAFVHLNGGNGLGQIVTHAAVETAAKKAMESGCCAIAIYNTNHIGMLSYYAIEAAKRDMISCIMCNTPPFVAATGGAEPAIGTNPICWGIPSWEFPIILDMAISPARGKIKNAYAAGKSIPEGWALNKYGQPTTDAKEALEGVLLPVGGPKGFGIGIIVEIFSAILSNANYGKNMPHPLDNYEEIPNAGSFVMLFDVSKIMDIGQFKDRVSAYKDLIKSTKKQKDVSGIYVPGEIEYLKMEQAVKEGLDIDDMTYEKIIKLQG